MDKTKMNLVQHLGELRKRIIIVLIAFIVFLCLSFIFVQDIHQFLVKDLDDKLALLGPGDILWIYMMIAGVVAIAATIPIAAFQVWKFVKPALKKEEQKATLAFIPGIFLLFLLGISFGYFILFPIVLSFLENLAGEQFEAFFTVDKYFSFMINLTLPFGFLFEMPAVIMFLTKLGIINPHRLVKARKISYFVLMIISVVISPPDLVSDVLVIVPLLILYEFSITLSKIVFRKKIELLKEAS
ncbi:MULTISPECIES: twin-arginine translocase subunit TatC [Metabacillus]|uniref:Sec-independent protein translocase protein TatC n=2 Tax=Metabacillus TaxID=2675233 RepID=A0A179T9K3_9BACI|nr:MULTISPECIES: twin-arginine translocase subunit TatC [Metabacillus]OAS89113.1 preprotein translocase subunit TatC [Metabacillus litoralis]QNF28626.1 twin-arginine translocase subunit TatC [Metabacillus sp. KUDC1714]